MILDKKFMVFLDELASSAPVPGGGGASAACGALAAALASMVANLTTGKKKYAQYEDDIQRILRDAEEKRKELVALADADAQAFEPLAKAYSLPKSTEEELAYREKVMKKVLYDASIAPLRIMETVSEVILLIEEVAEKGSVMAISDAGVAAVFAQAALKGASLNVFINTKSMKDRETAADLNAKAHVLIALGSEKTDAIFAKVMERLDN
ncbi:MAG: cyclodeaminase/cyclohydrolase family protein [Eubacterium sp.]|nr:cyclodeaminase/cyclohydrolase family protein [Eubacterium sp.]